jgi:hypothetical protein
MLGTISDFNLLNSFFGNAILICSRSSFAFYLNAFSKDLLTSLTIGRLGGVVVSVLALDPKVAGLNLAKAMDF